MIIKAINVDGHNIVISADVKQETEKGDMCVYVFV